METFLQYMSMPVSSKRNTIVIFWLGLSICSAVLFSGLGLRIAFSHPYVLEDDARQYVIVILRALDWSLFPNDLITEYFTSVTPPGFKQFYTILARLGVGPVQFSKILPFILSLFLTVMCFLLTIEIFPVPSAAFLACFLVNANLWTKPDLVSATPRAFALPLFVMFLYLLVRKRFFGVVIALILISAFYPLIFPVAAGTLLLQFWTDHRKKSLHSFNRRKLVWFCVGLILTLGILWSFRETTARFGPLVTKAQASKMPSFLAGGRQAFFSENQIEFWLTGVHSGFFAFHGKPAFIWVGLLLPLLLRYRSRFEPVEEVAEKSKLLLWILLASSASFGIAHALLFQLYNPGRYTRHTVPFVLALSSGISFVLIVAFLLQRCKAGRRNVAAFVSLLVLAVVVSLSFDRTYAYGSGYRRYVFGRFPDLYEFFSRTPKGSLIASLAEEANNLPVFSQRRILVGREYALPYHLGYFQQIHRRTADLIRAQYSPNLHLVKEFIRTYGVDYLLVERTAFQPDYFSANQWIQEFQPEARNAQQEIRSGNVPAISKLIPKCVEFQNETFTVLGGPCILGYENYKEKRTENSFSSLL